MDLLNQSKLTKSEWESLELPLQDKEKHIVSLIRDGYTNTSIQMNYSKNIMDVSKLPVSEEMHYYIYKKYFESMVVDLLKQASEIEFTILEGKNIKKLKSGETIRVQNTDNIIQNHRNHIYEFSCIELCKKLIKKRKKNEDFASELYTLIHWCQVALKNSNTYLMRFIDCIIKKAESEVRISDVVLNAHNIVENNYELHNFDDVSLYSHQKEIFTFSRTNRLKPKLILYTAPTGTGKTLTPLGLAEGYKIIFVCVARHIGLSLAKSAICVGKRVAFAFGCETASDIRLHYFAAVDYEKNKRSGGIGKVDNSNGSAVEIMICDVQSYLIAMYYMQSFNSSNDLLMYWDEPTMTLDYDTHVLHESIHAIWNKNTVPHVVLSCATLPNEEDIQDCIHDFRSHFIDSAVHTISSYDCRKSIPIINKQGYSFMPHIHCIDFDQLQNYSRYCEENKTLLRYFDLKEIVVFIKAFHEDLPENNMLHMNVFFDTLSNLDMTQIKLYYLKLLKNLTEASFTKLRSLLAEKQEPKYKKFVSAVEESLAGVFLTTKDAYTLTDGPTIYIADNLMNLSAFYVKQSDIPDFILNQMIERLKQNDTLYKTILALEEELEVKTKVTDNTDKTLDSTKFKKTGKDKGGTREKKTMDENTQVLKYNIEQYKKQIGYISLNSVYVPNSRDHQQKWGAKSASNNAFSSSLDEPTTKQILDLEIPNNYKLLALMGIGVLIKHESKVYEDIIKRLAQEQKLYLILASSDFIYGTNYQFCHGFIGKDLPNMTQQKVLQIMGRVGRVSAQQTYSVRFRNDEMIHKLFVTPSENKEAINMNKLLCHD